MDDAATVLKYPCIPSNRHGIEVEAQLLAILGNHLRILAMKVYNEFGLMLRYAQNGNLYEFITSRAI